MYVVIINPPNTDTKTYIARTANRWPHRVRRGKLFSSKMFPTYPIYLAYGAAMLEREKHKVVMLDAAERNYNTESVIDIICKTERPPDLIIAEISAPSRNSDLLFISKLKEKFCNSHITLVGSHATIYHKDLLENNKDIDSICRGEYFLTLTKLANALESNVSLGDVKGLSFNKNGEIQINHKRDLIKNLNDLPFPARHLLDPLNYRVGHYTYAPQILMLTSMGCPAKCTYCVWPQVLYEGKVRFRSSESVVEEMLRVKSDYKAREIYFDDDTFNVTEKRVMDICSKMIEKNTNIPWITEMRCDVISLDMLRLMKKAGCIKILYGVESGNQNILNNCKKGVTLQQIRDAFDLTRKAKIKTHAAFMLGLPGETKDTIQETIKFAKELKADTIQCSIAQPYPGTEFFNQAQRDGTLKFSQWEEFDGELMGTIEYPHLSKQYIRDSVGRMYRQYYLDPMYLIRRVMAIRSIADVIRFSELFQGFIRRITN